MDASNRRGVDLEPVLVRLAHQMAHWPTLPLAPAVEAKVQTCVRDLIGCALEAMDKPWSVQARSIVVALPPGHSGSATVIAQEQASSTADAAFANAVMGHGLVREDMHAASVSHLGVAVIPAVLALSQRTACQGADLVAAIVVGYELGAQIGRALMTPELARVHRPTGITGPLAAAAAGARLLRLDPVATTHALALAANMTGGLNEWGLTGGSEMYFHPGLAARSGVTAALLAQAGAQASATALDGPSGLFASLGQTAQLGKLGRFGEVPELMQVYHKAVPACNFAQTACQVAALLAQESPVRPDEVSRIVIGVPHAAAAYPGCDQRGPYLHTLQAKMSIQFNVVAALLTGRTVESNFDLRGDARLDALLTRTELCADPQLSSAFPARQGAYVELHMRHGAIRRRELDDVQHATAQDVRQRFMQAAQQQWGMAAAAALDHQIESLPRLEDAGGLAACLGARGPAALHRAARAAVALEGVGS